MIRTDATAKWNQNISEINSFLFETEIEDELRWSGRAKRSNRREFHL